MKIKVFRDQLNKGLKIIERIITKSLTLPILENVLLSTEKSFFNLSATNLETSIIYKILAKIEKEGKTVVPAKLFSSYINLLPEEAVVLELKNKKLTIQSKNYQTFIKTLESSEFPIIPETAAEQSLSVNNEPFIQGISQVADIASFSQIRPEISGVYLKFQKDSTKFVATDSFRLSEKTLYYEQPLKIKESSFIIPYKAAKELINILGEEKGKLEIYFSPNQVMFEYPAGVKFPQFKVQFMSRLIEGEYPNYEEIIPKQHQTEIILPRDKFLDQIKLTSLFSGKNNEIRLKADPGEGKVELFSQSPEYGENKGILSGRVTGKKVEASFNWRFLMDGILKIKSPEIIFFLNGEGDPALLKPKGDPDYLYVIMPIKTS